MKIEGPLWIESKPEEGEFSGSTIYIQFISFNDKEMDYENPHHTAKVMSAMLTPNDVETIGDKDPSSFFSTVATTRWATIPDYLQESIAALKVFGEDTVVARRHWSLEDDNLVPIVVERIKG